MAWSVLGSLRTCGLFILSVFLAQSMTAVSVDHVDVGFSASNMKYVDNDGFFLLSEDGTFALGLPNFGRESWYYLCMKHVKSKTNVWAANRDFPVSKSDSFVLSEDGDAALVVANGTKVWSTSTAGLGVKRMQLQESGNLVLLNGANKTVWQSFDHPTDTLLSGQTLRQGMKLVGGFSSTNISSGPYFLSMQSGNLLLSVDYNPPQSYWNMAQDARTARVSSGTPVLARLDGSGLSLVADDAATVLQIPFSNVMASTPRRASLDPYGNLQLYAFVAGIWSPQFIAVVNECSLPLSCGPYGICSGLGQCSCPESMLPLNSSDLSHGCRSRAYSSCSRSSDVQFQRVGSGLDYFANQFSRHEKASGIDSCQQRCQHDCSCVTFFYYQESNLCFVFSHLGTMQRVGNENHTAYVKLDGLPQSETPPLATSPSNGSPNYVVPIIIAGAVLLIIGMISCFACYFYRARLRFASSEEPPEEPLDDDIFLEAIPGLPARFSYKELEIATAKFSMRLGSGGFGSVYEGTLADKSKVAVKQLEGVGQGKKEFRAEVAIIGSIHHIHLVRLRGFCAERAHRLLVYEFMANGSLDKCLFVNSETSSVLDWNTRYSIALGTARGLAYLHDDCREKIIHCDIKPENILLDENYVAKVSDFGLAKLINKEQSQVFTTLRGTRGYLAPEWLMNLRLSEKSDVYSFGMVLLEIISGRKNFDPSESSEKWYFPAYAFQQAENGKLEELVDIKLKESAVVEQVVTAVRVALWCIQEDAAIRPSMGKVVQMLEGNIAVHDPPLSSLFAVRLHARMVEALSTEENVSSPDYNSRDMLSAIQLSEPR